jgi:hypothetical protein
LDGERRVRSSRGRVGMTSYSLAKTSVSTSLRRLFAHFSENHPVGWVNEWNRDLSTVGLAHSKTTQSKR